MCILKYFFVYADHFLLPMSTAVFDDVIPRYRIPARNKRLEIAIAKAVAAVVAVHQCEAVLELQMFLDKTY